MILNGIRFGSGIPSHSIQSRNRKRRTNRARVFTPDVITHTNALPAKHTDFLFAVLGEELGFLGCLLVICLLLAIILRCFQAAKTAKTSFGTIVCTGVGAMLLFHSIGAIGMCIGLTPVTGTPLPFFSYGGTALVTAFIGIGLVMNARYKT